LIDNEDMADTAFSGALSVVADVEGWLTDDQARRLWDRASELRPPARIVEIGSYRGRSAIVMALAAAEGVSLTAIDPHAGNDRGPREIEGYSEQAERDLRAFRANLERAGVASTVEHLRLPSQEALGQMAGEAELVYVDGAHRYRPARADIARWGARLRPGGRLLVHDAFSAVGVTLALLRVTVLGPGFRYVGRTGSLAEYVREDVRAGGRLANAARQLAQLPWFVRNLLVKVALVARLRPLARLLGHRSGEWPY
jgi:SAM-dependent methyltransferase